MKANHNRIREAIRWRIAVSNGSKILKWKQITTDPYLCSLFPCCFQWFKDTKMKANHNIFTLCRYVFFAVSNGSKILKWKQITTAWTLHLLLKSCFQWFKDTKMKANHNSLLYVCSSKRAVSNGSKILKWKQITTQSFPIAQWILLFPMVQRY